MPAPSTSPLFATDTAYTSAPGEDFDGSPPRVALSAAERAEGFTPGQLAAESLNDQLALLGEWAEWSEEERARLSTYAGDDGPDLPADVTWSRMIAASSFVQRVAAGGAPSWTVDPNDGFLSSVINSANGFFDLTPVLRRDASIVLVRVLVDPGVAGPRMNFDLRRTHLGVTTGVPAVTATSQGTAQDDAVGALQWVTITPASPLPVSAGLPSTSPMPLWRLYLSKGADVIQDNVYACQVVQQGSAIRNG